MNKHYIKTTLYGLCLAACSMMLAVSAQAQYKLADNAMPMIVSPNHQVVDYRSRVLHVDVPANVDYQVTCNAEWVHVKQNNNGLFLIIDENYYSEPRSTQIFFHNDAKKMMREMSLTQEENRAANELKNEKFAVPTSATASAAQKDEGIEKSYDGDFNTLYHSPWSGGVSSSNPITLTYNFAAEDIEHIIYVPRQSGGENGIFQNFDVLIKHVGDTNYKLFKSFSWPGDHEQRVISLGEQGQEVLSIRFVVKQGAGGFASCAEMQFIKPSQNETNDFDIFADDLYTQLKPGFTAAQLEDIDNPLAKSLAAQLLNHTYDTKYRVAEYKCHNSPQYYSDLWGAPGKFYDQIAGVTGINVKKNSNIAVVVRGIPDGADVKLKIVAWYEGKEGSNFDGGNPITSTYTLKNGINPINYAFGYDGLAYICYYSYGESKKFPPIRVHFVNGQVNGYLSPDKTNEEMHELTANAKNVCMDLVGQKVHSVWTSDGLHKYCKSTTGTIGYRQYMNLLDTIIEWEHKLLGFEKYKVLPDLRTMAYVNYTYYMFQGAFGVSFHHNQEKRVLNCENLMYHDHDAVWGLSHEWGHQHQMAPLFNWAGMSEVSNNMNSYYNTYHMGFTKRNGGWLSSIGPEAGLKIYYGTAPNKVGDPQRQAAYDAREQKSWNADMYKVCSAMNNPKYVEPDVDKLHSFSYNNYQTLRSLIAIYQFATDSLGCPDYGPDIYESFRQSNNPEGSKIEKKTGLDKYELLASAQTQLPGKYQEFVKKYPNSVWVTRNYLKGGKCDWRDNSVPYIMNWVMKASRLTGYNLFPYFEKAGFLRQVALYINDYGWKWYVMTPQMYDEFKSDMDKLEADGELKHCSDDLVRRIFAAPIPEVPRPNIPN